MSHNFNQTIRHYRLLCHHLEQYLFEYSAAYPLMSHELNRYYHLLMIVCLNKIISTTFYGPKVKSEGWTLGIVPLKILILP